MEKQNIVLLLSVTLCTYTAQSAAPIVTWHGLNGNIVLLFTLTLCTYTAQSATPIVTWHGLNGNANQLKSMHETIRKTIPDVYFHNVMIGESLQMDQANSVLMRANDQVAEVCNQIKNNSMLSGGYNGIAYSQGGQFLRGVAERCPDPPMKNLITMGSQHQGVYGVPGCQGESDLLCELLRSLLSLGAYIPWIQDIAAPCQYWHDPLNQTAYEEGSHYIAQINNEGPNKNDSYRTNLANLHNFVMVMWKDETTVEPKESSHFEFYGPGEEFSVLPLEESRIYQEDWIGLKELDESGRLHRLVSEGDHMAFHQDWFTENIVKVYLV